MLKRLVAFCAIAFAIVGCDKPTLGAPPDGERATTAQVTHYTAQVTHYYVPLLGDAEPRKSPCHSIEGVCKYSQDNVQYIYNYTGRFRGTGPAFVRHAYANDEPVEGATCEYGVGYGLKSNCTHPCRSLAASTSHHRRGEIIYFPGLVGQACGIGNAAIVHDGYMFVNDTGAKSKFNRFGRFDFFWGDCREFRGGVCFDGNARNIDQILDGAEFGIVWSPSAPDTNRALMIAFSDQLQQEAIDREDGPAALAVDLRDFELGGRLYKPLS